MSISVTRGNKLFERLGADAKVRLEAVIERTAKAVVEEAKQQAPVDTGALRASIHSVTEVANDYPLAAAEAQSLQPGVALFPEVKPSGPLEAIVAVAVEYGEDLEYGGVHQAAQPFFHPALESQKSKFFRDVAQALTQE